MGEVENLASGGVGWCLLRCLHIFGLYYKKGAQPKHRAERVYGKEHQVPNPLYQTARIF